MHKVLTDNAKHKLNKLGINNIEQLITYYPFRYDILKKSNISNVIDGQQIVIDGVVESIPNVYYINKKLNKMSFRINIGDRLLKVVIFNRAFFKSKLSIGTPVIIIGKYNMKQSSVTASNLKLGKLTHTIIEPIYHSNYSISSNQIYKYILNFLDSIQVDDYIPDYLNEKYNFMDKNVAIKLIHCPNNEVTLNRALNKLKYEELFLFMLKMNYLKQTKPFKQGIKRNVQFSLVQDFISKLPFKLTKDQELSVQSIYSDLIMDRRMNRLLQGDVGSGKTIISFIALYINYLSGYQGALMVPTEILAHQHFMNIKNIFKEYNISVALLIGKTKAKEKKEILNKLKSGSIDVIIGTHSLISDDVCYQNLGLVITDEQHRFGVNQRSNLRTKGLLPDVLYMSATPIPRTYALTLYGDMEISNIRTMPKGRKEIVTYLKKESEIKDVLEKMLLELKKGHQIYVIVPLVEESDKIDLKDTLDLEIKMNKAFGKYFNIGVIHGKMKQKEKDNIMYQYQNNEIQILISTTVIEVGIDVENATMMVIFDAYRFGLSTLHQLRGRVGRNEYTSYCILISNKETKRLNILTETTDGFKVCEEDFKLRGSGDLFGTKQSGDMNFKLANLKQDFNILIKAKADSLYFLSSKQYVNKKYQNIRRTIEKVNNLD